MKINRRLFLGMSVSIVPFLTENVVAGEVSVNENFLQGSWLAWKKKFLLDNGRVVDAYQQLSSHSEGQGYGMVLSALMNDLDTCKKIYAWTLENLAIRSDNLLAWRWMPDTTDPVLDLNNSSDGDLFFAWGCILAKQRFSTNDFNLTAQMIVQDLIKKCVRSDPSNSNRILLLPGADGFEKPEGITYNPSYPMPRALTELSSALNEPILDKLAFDSLDILSDIAALGATPDWLVINESGFAQRSQFNYVSGYDALRVPLFLVWSDEASHPALLSHRNLYQTDKKTSNSFPVVFDIITGKAQSFSDDIGYRAIVSYFDCMVNKSSFNSNKTKTMLPYYKNQPYFPATLHMMALLSQIERYDVCTPN